MKEPEEPLFVRSDTLDDDRPESPSRPSVLQAISESPPAILRRRLPASVVIASIVLGIVLRIWVSSFGHNYDVNSYAVVASIVDAGENVYAETHRYNYGPVWLHVIGAASRTARAWNDQFGFFTLLLTSLLTLVDLGLFFVLKRRAGDGVALLFFLNPVSIIISGYHRQFGNLALLMGLVAADLFDRSSSDRLDRRKWLGMIILGASLATKHFLFAFPFWLAAKQRRPLHRVVVFLVPVMLFAASFAPYWSDGSRGIINNVFLYRSTCNAPFWFGLMPPLISVIVPPIWGMLAALALTGLMFRRVPAFESVLLYTAVLLIFSPSLANQYLVLALPYIVWFLNPFGIAYAVGSTLILLMTNSGLALADPVRFAWLDTSGFVALVLCLFLSLLWIFHRRRMAAIFRSVWRWIGHEIRLLLRP
jgi:hypothetical protein